MLARSPQFQTNYSSPHEKHFEKVVTCCMLMLWFVNFASTLTHTPLVIIQLTEGHSENTRRSQCKGYGDEREKKKTKPRIMQTV